MKDTSFLFLVTGLKIVPPLCSLSEQEPWRQRTGWPGRRWLGSPTGLLRWSRCLAPQTWGEGGSLHQEEHRIPSKQCWRHCFRETQQKAEGSAGRGRTGGVGWRWQQRIQTDTSLWGGSSCQMIASHPCGLGSEKRMAECKGSLSCGENGALAGS